MNPLVDQSFQTQPFENRVDHELPTIRNQVWVVKGEVDWSIFRDGALQKVSSEFGLLTTLNTIILPILNAPSAGSRHSAHHPHRWIKAEIERRVGTPTLLPFKLLGA